MEFNKTPLMLVTGIALSSLLIGCGGSGSSSTSSSTTGSSSAATTATPAATTTAPASNTGSTTAVSSTTTSTTSTTPVTPVVVTPPPPPPPSSRYVKLDGAGNELPSSATSWSCVKDKDTGLVWEEKSNDDGLRDKDWRYRHFHNSGGYASNVDYNGNVLCQNVGSSSCDAYTYVNALNGSGLCGRNSWRLPLMEELLGLIQLNADGRRPNIDLDYFPETVNMPGKAAYCSENMNTARTCGDAYANVKDDGSRVECNYQGVDYGLSVRVDNPRGDSMVPLRFYGEVQDGLTAYPNANWICYTRLVSSY